MNSWGMAHWHIFGLLWKMAECLIDLDLLLWRTATEHLHLGEVDLLVVVWNEGMCSNVKVWKIAGKDPRLSRGLVRRVRECLAQ